MSDIIIREEILEPMQRLYVPPRSMEPAQQMAAMRDYMDSLRSFDREDLQAAWRTVRDSHQGRGWPLPSVFVLAARAARKERLPQAKEPAVNRFKHPEGEINRHVWRQLRSSRTASIAMAEGWAWSLKAKVLDGTIKAEGDISVGTFRAAHKRALWLVGRLKPDGVDNHGRPWTDAALACVAHWHDIEQRERETADEIAEAAAEPARERTKEDLTF